MTGLTPTMRQNYASGKAGKESRLFCRRAVNLPRFVGSRLGPQYFGYAKELDPGEKLEWSQEGLQHCVCVKALRSCAGASSLLDW